jgi:hypothetical protein
MRKTIKKKTEKELTLFTQINTAIIQMLAPEQQACEGGETEEHLLNGADLKQR